MEDGGQQKRRYELEHSQYKLARIDALSDQLRTMHADHAKQLRETAAAMHRWVMASLLLINTGAIVTMLNAEGAIVQEMLPQLGCWSLGACLAIFTGSFHSSADAIDSIGWQSLASRIADAPDVGLQDAEREKDQTTVERMRNTAAILQFCSVSSFAAGIAYVAGYL